MQFIYSKFAADEDWQELLHDLIADLPQRLTALDSAVATADFDSLAFLVHQLKGACGSYGFEEVTVLASQLESVMRLDTDPRSWRSELSAFRIALQSMTAEPDPTIINSDV